MPRTPRDYESLAAEIAERLTEVGDRGSRISLDEILLAYREARALFRALLRGAGWPDEVINALLTKFHDAGRRSAPWKAFSGVVPGRPQDGKDGNRINRWDLPTDHKQYADERTATLVELRYIFQALSMEAVPEVPGELANAWIWLLDHPIRPGAYRDPIELVPMDLWELGQSTEHRREMTSGHFVPLDRGGRHVPDNTFLTLRSSNSLQGNLTLDELLEVLDRILQAHRARGWTPLREQ